MNRVIKTAVAVATFGLAAALSIPAQAQTISSPAGDDPLNTVTGSLTPLRGGVSGDSVGGALGSLKSVLGAVGPLGNLGAVSPLGGLGAGKSALGGLGVPLRTGAIPLEGAGVPHGLRTQDIGSPAAGQAEHLGTTPSGMVGASPLGGVLGGVTSSALPLGAADLAKLGGRTATLASGAAKSHMSGTARAGGLIPLDGQIVQLGAAPLMHFMAQRIGGQALDEVAPLVENAAGSLPGTGVNPSAVGDTLGTTNAAVTAIGR
ncbi:hypothetical protein ACIBHX_39220 [Nonomuraea sp. NPDC050536]|uniref:hypothetical protein n=1 Tax=Nonomuraea sp. NPDC050536 TaxID=3364366 RepID=UPI0037C9A43D